VRRFLAFLVGNWPLKLGAIALATVLYGGVAISENTGTWPNPVPIDVLNPPTNAAVLDFLGSVTSIRYRAPLEVASQITNGSFRASVDLSNVQPQPGGAPIDVAVNVFAIDRRVQIVDFSPPAVRVRIDTVQTSSLPVTVDYGVAPEAFQIGAPQVTPTRVSVTGASSRVASIRSITARVTIDASGLNVDQEVNVLPLDEQGSEVPGLRVQPSRVHVRISVARELANATLPVVPRLVGVPASGYQVTATAVDPLVLGVGGEGPVVARLANLDTAPIDVAGNSVGFVSDVAVVAPPGITITGPATVRVTVTITPIPATRVFEIALETRGDRSEFSYGLSKGTVLITLSGPAPVLDGLDASQLHAIVDVAALGAGSSTVFVNPIVPPTVKLVGINPASVDVVVRAAPPGSPSPSPIETPAASPPPSPLALPSTSAPAP
jgi:YbbR domain-containing protein